MNSQLNIFGKCLAKMKKKNVNSMMRDLRPRRGAGNSLHSWSKASLIFLEYIFLFHKVDQMSANWLNNHAQRISVSHLSVRNRSHIYDIIQWKMITNIQQIKQIHT